MKFSQMEYFLEVAEQLNFTAAAKALYISQPALSKQIALLEEELGTMLFLRNSRQVALTKAGIAFEKDLKEIRRHLELAQKHAVEIGKTEKLIFRIGCFDGAVVDDFLPAVYRHIEALVPDMQISLFRGSFQENRKALEMDAIDLLLTLSLDFIPDDRYHTRNIIKRRGALIYSQASHLAQKKHLSFTDFETEPFLILHRQLSPGLYENACNNLKHLGIINPHIEEVENFATLFAYLELGRGYTLLTEDVTENKPQLRKILLDDSMGTEVMALWKKEHAIAELLMDRFCI